MTMKMWCTFWGGVVISRQRVRVRAHFRAQITWSFFQMNMGACCSNLTRSHTMYYTHIYSYKPVLN